jgi:hypothetical protein
MPVGSHRCGDHSVKPWGQSCRSWLLTIDPSRNHCGIGNTVVVNRGK